MSDDVQEAPHADVPQAMLVPRNEGGYVGLMHLGDTVRTFIAGEISHARKLFASAGISEFHMDQDSADAMADRAVQKHVDEAVASVPEPAPDVGPTAEPVPTHPEPAPLDPAPEQPVDEAAEAEAQSAAEPDSMEPQPGGDVVAAEDDDAGIVEFAAEHHDDESKPA